MLYALVRFWLEARLFCLYQNHVPLQERKSLEEKKQIEAKDDYDQKKKHMGQVLADISLRSRENVDVGINFDASYP